MGVSEIRRNKPISGPSRLVPARLPRVTGAELRVANGAEKPLVSEGLDTRA